MRSHVIISFSDLPSVVITGGTSVKTVSVGKNLTLECIANGTPQPEIQWTSVDGLLPEGLISKGGQLIFPRARLAYGGVYRCKVTNSAGSVQSEVAIFVQGWCFLFVLFCCYLSRLLVCKRN